MGKIFTNAWLLITLLQFIQQIFPALKITRYMVFKLLFYLLQMLMNNIMAGIKTDMSCPSHPAPLVPMPSPLPDNITNAIQAVEKIFSDIIDNDTSVCTTYVYGY